MGWIDDRLSEGKLITVKELYNKFGFRNVIGVNIYGRKAIAGPICVTALIMKPNHKFDLKPADKLSLMECRDLNERIRLKADMLNIGWASVDTISIVGMKEAILGALRTALIEVSAFNPPSVIFMDNFTMDPLPNGVRDSRTPIYIAKRGREQVETIMAASIVSRVARHTVMSWMHKDYPEYEWEQNEGFTTPRHIQLIKEHGISIYHRDLSNVKSLADFKAFPNEKWRKMYENSYTGQ